MSGLTLVKNVESVVLVVSVANIILCIPRDGKETIILEPGGMAQMTWAEFVRAKQIPGFGHNIELHDSVTITPDGNVLIRDVAPRFSHDTMIELLSLAADRIKENVLQMSTGDRLSFSTFLETRIKLGIEAEKSRVLIDFIRELEEEKNKVEPIVLEVSPEEPDAASAIPVRRPAGRPRKDQPSSE